jgi:hypothetical protein
MLYKDLIAVNSESCTQPTLCVGRTLNFLELNCRHMKYLLCFIVIMPTDYTKHLGCLTHVVTQLVEVLSYKPVGRGLDSRWCHWLFSLT